MEANADNYLEIPVTYKEEELSFSAWLLMAGYTHRIQVDVYGHLILFEPDEERNYRAILDNAQLDQGIKVDVALLQAIASVIESVVK